MKTGWGIVYRVNNPRLRNYGRLEFLRDDLGEPITSADKVVAEMTAEFCRGFVIPASRVWRMFAKKRSRVTGLPLICLLEIYAN